MLKKLSIGLGALVAILLVVLWTGVIEDYLFAVWEPNPMEAPVEAGPLDVATSRVEVADGADGDPFGITVYAPVDADQPLPTLVWVMGSNVQAYYHEELHEALASHGYLVVAPDTRTLRFLDFDHHAKIVALAGQATRMALAGELGPTADPGRLAFGGYSVGGPLAAIVAAGVSEADAVVHWAPSPAPYWQGIDGDSAYGRVDEPALYVLGGVDVYSEPEDGPADDLIASMPGPATKIVIPGANHHQFQQPQGGADLWPEAEISLEAQQAGAIEATLDWLDTTLDVAR